MGVLIIIGTTIRSYLQAQANKDADKMQAWRKPDIGSQMNGNHWNPCGLCSLGIGSCNLV